MILSHICQFISSRLWYVFPDPVNYKTLFPSPATFIIKLLRYSTRMWAPNTWKENGKQGFGLMRSLGFDQVEYEGKILRDHQAYISCLVLSLAGQHDRQLSVRRFTAVYIHVYVHISLCLTSTEHVHTTLFVHNTKLKSDLGNVGKMCVIIFCLCPGFDAISLQETSGVWC